MNRLPCHALKLRPPRALTIAILCLGLAGAATPAGGENRRPEEALPGVVVEEVGRGSALEGAGLRPGDLLLAWERSPDPPANPEGGDGEIRTVFDWSWVTTEQAPRGTVRLRGERNGVATSFEIQRGLWDARVRPRMAADVLQTYTEGRQRVVAGDLAGGVVLWNQLVQGVEPQAAPGLRSWILLQIGAAWSQGAQGDKARSALQAALAEAGDARAQVALWEALGESYVSTGELTHAEAAFRSALEIGETAWGESLQVARTIARLGCVLQLQGVRLDAATQLQSRALEMRQRWAPDSLAVADSLHQLFLLATVREDPEAMSGYLQRALTLQERWPADSLAKADTLNDLGVLEAMHGRHAEAAARCVDPGAAGSRKHRDDP